MQLLDQIIHLNTEETVFETTTCRQQEVYKCYRILRGIY